MYKITFCIRCAKQAKWAKKKFFTFHSQPPLPLWALSASNISKKFLVSKLVLTNLICHNYIRNWKLFFNNFGNRGGGGKIWSFENSKKYPKIIRKCMLRPSLRFIEWKLWSIANRKGFRYRTTITTTNKRTFSMPYREHNPQTSTKPSTSLNDLP